MKMKHYPKMRYILFIVEILLFSMLMAESKVITKQVQKDIRVNATSLCSLIMSSPESRQTTFFDWLTSIFQQNGNYSGNSTTTTTPSIPETETQRECSDCTCGSINTIKRIVGGQETQVHQYPWMAMLMFRGRFYCGGTLIDDQHVVTAAHCMRGFITNLVTVRLLVHNRQNITDTVINRTLSRVYIHEKYSTRRYDNDIALLRLSKPVEMNDMMRPVCLPAESRSYDHEVGVATGWGATKEGGVTAHTLQEVEVPILSTEECRNSSYGPSRITDNMMCAGVPEGGKDSCQGDSGGPLHVEMADTSSYHLVGVVSWGEGCARPNIPGVYTRVSRYLQWIESKTKGYSCKCRVPDAKEQRPLNTFNELDVSTTEQH